ncbi:MAG: ComEC/Rec2 family competence protein [Cytophagales bacterium]
MRHTAVSLGNGRRPFLRFSVALLIGVITGYLHCEADSFPVLSYLLAWLFALYIFLFISYRSKGVYQNSTLFGVLALAMLVLVGHVRVLQQYPKNRKSHFSHVVDQVVAYEGIVLGTPRKTKMQQSVLVSVRRVSCNGRWLVVSGRFRLIFPIHVKGVFDGVSLCVQGHPILAKAPVNPHAVDYNSRWRLQGAFYEHAVSKAAIQKISPTSWWRSWRHQVLVKSTVQIAAAIKDKEVAGVVLALVLGDKHGLQGVGDIYKKTGVMHVLAVSGLHVGLIYGLLILLFGVLAALFGGWLGRLRHHRWIALLLLWAYATLVGFPPSVVRAVGGLSLMVLARTLRRSYDRINGLCVLFFFSLLYNPCWLFDIGFQLSFMAMLGIFIFYPPIVNAWRASNPYASYCWQGAALSIAAQLTTAPLSIYYFHHFPLYFLLGNAVMIPMVTCLLVLGFILLSSTWLGFQGCFISDLLMLLVRKSTLYLHWLGSLPGAYVGPFHWCNWAVLCCYLVLGCFYFGMKNRQLRYLVLATLLLSMASMVSIHYQIKRTTQRRIVVYDVAPRKVIGFFKGPKAILLGDRMMDAGVGYYRYQILPSLDWWGIKSITQGDLLGMGVSAGFCRTVCGLRIYVWEGKQLAFVDKKHVCSRSCKGLEDIDLDVVYITGDSVYRMEGLLGKMKIGLILLDEQSKRYAGLVEEATRLDIPVRYGSYVLSCG